MGKGGPEGQPIRGVKRTGPITGARGLKKDATAEVSAAVTANSDTWKSPLPDVLTFHGMLKKIPRNPGYLRLTDQQREKLQAALKEAALEDPADPI